MNSDCTTWSDLPLLRAIYRLHLAVQDGRIRAPHGKKTTRRDVIDEEWLSWLYSNVNKQWVQDGQRGGIFKWNKYEVYNITQRMRKCPNTGAARVAWVAFERDLSRCAFCHKAPPNTAVTTDHTYPQKEGGTDDLPNLQLSCKSCNSSQGYRKRSQRGLNAQLFSMDANNG